MIRIIKETIIMLLICLVGMLLFAVILYKYIPNRKVVPDVAKYKPSEQIKEQLADTINEENEKIVKTYEVTSNDLNNYIVKNEYVPGKANPFAAVAENPETNTVIGNPGSPAPTGNNSSGGNSTSGGNTSSGSNTVEPKEPATK